MLFADVRDPDDARACVRCVRADAPGDEGTYGVAMRRIAYMSYGGTRSTSKHCATWSWC